MKFTQKSIVVSAVTLVSFTLLALNLSAEEIKTESDKPSYWLCQIKEVVRSIRVDKKDNGSCVTVYTKEGVDEVVGKSSTMKTCEEVAQKIYNNLVKADWKCKDIRARVSISHE